MTTKTQAASVSHTDETIKELLADRPFAVAYLKAAFGELGGPDNRATGLLALRDVAEAYGGLGMMAEQAGISREALKRGDALVSCPQIPSRCKPDRPPPSACSTQTPPVIVERNAQPTHQTP